MKNSSKAILTMLCSAGLITSWFVADKLKEKAVNIKEDSIDKIVNESSERKYSDVLSLVSKYAKVEPARTIEHNKPFFLYMGQNHVSKGKYSAESADCQVQLYHLLYDLIKNNLLSAVYDEGWAEEKGGASYDFKQRFGPMIREFNDGGLGVFLEKNPKLDAVGLILLSTDFDNAYGFFTEKTFKQLIEKPPEQHLEKVQGILDLLEQGAEEGSLILSRKQVQDYYNTFEDYIDILNKVSYESIFNTAKILDHGHDKNIAVIVGADHIIDIKKYDSEKKLNSIHDMFNLVYVFPPGTEEREKKSKKNTMYTHLNHFKNIKDIMEKKNKEYIKINVNFSYDKE